MRVLPHPALGEIRLEAVLHALADPARLEIVGFLAAAGEASCSDIDLAVSKSTGTHHYRVLREAGIISQVYRGTSKMNSLRRDDLDALFPGLLASIITARQNSRRGAEPFDSDGGGDHAALDQGGAHRFGEAR